MKPPFVLVGDSIQGSMARIVRRHIPLMRENASKELKAVCDIITNTNGPIANRAIWNKWYGSELFLLEYVRALGVEATSEQATLLSEKCPNSNILPVWARNPKILLSQLCKIAAWENLYRINSRMEEHRNWRNYAESIFGGNVSIIERVCLHEYGKNPLKMNSSEIASLVRGAGIWSQTVQSFFMRNHYLRTQNGSYHDEIANGRHEFLRTVPKSKYERQAGFAQRRAVRRSATLQLSSPVDLQRFVLG